MAASYLGQPQAVRGETDIIDLSNSPVSSAFLHIPSLKNAHGGQMLCITGSFGNNSVSNEAAGAVYADLCLQLSEFVCLTHIHMHPDVVLFADVRNGNERVKGSVHCCSSCCTHKERYETLQRHKQTMPGQLSSH